MTVVNAAIIQEDKLLIVRKQQTWILPGGKLETGETNLEGLCREIGEELTSTKIKNIRFYDSFTGITPHTKRETQVRVYFADIDGRLYGVREGDTVLEAVWTNDFSSYNLSPITQDVVSSLQENNYLGKK